VVSYDGAIEIALCVLFFDKGPYDCYLRSAKTYFMTQFTPNANRFDPYKNFKFRVKVDGKIVAGIVEVLGLPAAAISKKYNKTKQPGLTKFTSVTLKRGVSHDTAFINWAKNISAHSPNRDSTRSDFRKDISIEVYDEAGKLVSSYLLTRSFPSKISAADLKADGNEVAIETIELTHEGLEITPC
jgi:phage tail-like protein